MTQDIFFCDNTKKPPAEGDKGEEEKSEEVLVVRGRSAGEKNIAMFLLAGREFDSNFTGRESIKSISGFWASQQKHDSLRRQKSAGGEEEEARAGVKKSASSNRRAGCHFRRCLCSFMLSPREAGEREETGSYEETGSGEQEVEKSLSV